MKVLERDLAPGQWEIVTDNMGLVYSCAFRLPRHLHDDAVIDGSLGLLRAVQTFNPDLGPFAPHAVRSIRFAISTGRAAALGGNYRQAKGHNNGGPVRRYVPPDSLDTVDDDGLSKADRIAHRGPSVEDEAESRVTLDQLRSALLNLCVTDLDYRIVDEIFADDYLRFQHVADRLAAEFGIPPDNVRYRRRRMFSMIDPQHFGRNADVHRCVPA